MSVWEYGCKFEFSQDDCGVHSIDTKSRGFRKWDGCPSCIHRKPGNVETLVADEKYQDRDM